jgi:hypothetical protein
MPSGNLKKTRKSTISCQENPFISPMDWFLLAPEERLNSGDMGEDLPMKDVDLPA